MIYFLHVLLQFTPHPAASQPPSPRKGRLKNQYEVPIMGSPLSRKSLKDILKVAFSNVAKLLSGVLVGLLLPKIIGVTDYGYYKTFTLYGVYVGLFTFGITDGIYLKFGGKDYSELNKPAFRFYTRFYFLMELVFSVLAAAVAVFLLPGEYRFIFICLAIYLLFFNITSFFQTISQITGRFTELSVRNLLQSLLQAIAILFMYFNSQSVSNLGAYINSYRFFTGIYVSITCLLALWYIFTYRDLVFGSCKDYKAGKSDILYFVKSGTPLLVSNLSMLLLLSLDRQFVNVLFTTDEYAVYAFAYNILTLFSTTLSAISTVLYPALKRTDEESLKSSYIKLVFSVMMLSFAGALLYYPLLKFIPWFLPKYTDALPIFRIIIPGLAISSAVTIVMHNYYKVLGENLRFFRNCLCILSASFSANLVAYLIFGTREAISVASILVLLLWYILTERLSIKHYGISSMPIYKNMLYILIMGASFYLSTMINIWWLGMLVYAAVLGVVTLFFKPNDHAIV